MVPNFVIQGGDPFTRHDDMKARWGTGGPGFKIKDELSGKKQVHKRGSLSMAHAGPGTGGSQFFVCHSPQPHLDKKHTVFGQVITGLDVDRQDRSRRPDDQSLGRVKSATIGPWGRRKW